MQKILVIGAGGAGKSTLAAQLAERTGLPLIHLDSLYWRPGWVEPPAAEWEATVDRLLLGERWVIDGNYGGTLERRLQACDTVLFLDLPRALCVARVLKRWLRYRGRSRPELTLGCPERLSWAFLCWVWTYRQRRRPRILERLARLRADQRVIVLSSPTQVTQFLTGLFVRSW